ncbi:10138_t:CDS:2, partial [Funneliformis caledonium]
MSNVYQAIANLDSNEERTALRTFFTQNPEKRTEAELILPTCSNEDVVAYLKDLLKSEFPNKRMKVDYGDLLNFWKALRTTTIGEKDNSLKLPDNIHFLGRTDEASVLFIRQCYRDLFKVVFSNNTRRLIITGNPGIGKTFFDYYILYELMRKNATVIYDKANKFPILFSNQTAVVGETLFSFYDLLNKQDVWYIVDGKEPHDVDAKTILEKIYKNKVDKKIVDDLFYKWGGIPRFVLEKANEGTQQNKLQEAIDECDESILMGEQLLRS